MTYYPGNNMGLNYNAANATWEITNLPQNFIDTSAFSTPNQAFTYAPPTPTTTTTEDTTCPPGYIYDETLKQCIPDPQYQASAYAEAPQDKPDDQAVDPNNPLGIWVPPVKNPDGTWTSGYVKQMPNTMAKFDAQDLIDWGKSKGYIDSEGNIIGPMQATAEGWLGSVGQALNDNQFNNWMKRVENEGMVEGISGPAGRVIPGKVKIPLADIPGVAPAGYMHKTWSEYMDAISVKDYAAERVQTASELDAMQKEADLQRMLEEADKFIAELGETQTEAERQRTIDELNRLQAEADRKGMIGELDVMQAEKDRKRYEAERVQTALELDAMQGKADLQILEATLEEMDKFIAELGEIQTEAERQRTIDELNRLQAEADRQGMIGELDVMQAFRDRKRTIDELNRMQAEKDKQRTVSQLGIMQKEKDRQRTISELDAMQKGADKKRYQAERVQTASELDAMQKEADRKRGQKEQFKEQKERQQKEPSGPSGGPPGQPSSGPHYGYRGRPRGGPHS
jgi:hypothetical protein